MLTREETTELRKYLNENINSISHDLNMVKIKLVTMKDVRIKAIKTNNALEINKKDIQFEVLSRKYNFLLSEKIHFEKLLKDLDLGKDVSIC